MPKISIVIPVYNAKNYLRKCLESIVGQTCNDIEIIIVNDGSTDTSAEICRDFLSDPRVKYFYQENAGPAVAMNFGMSIATGEYVWFVDADDWIEKDAVERLQSETADMVIFNFYRGENQKHHEPIPDGIYDRDGIQKVVFPQLVSYIDSEGNVNHLFHNTWMRLYKRSFLLENDIRFRPDIRNGLDLLFSFEVAVKANTISVKPNTYLYHYMPADNSMTSSYVKNYWERRKVIIDTIYKLIPFDFLRMQMPLRIFSWAVIGIENELHYEKGTKENIRAIVSDSVCDVFKGKLDVSLLNSQNRKYYEQICREDVHGIWQDYRRQLNHKKRKKTFKKIKHTIRSFLKF